MALLNSRTTATRLALADDRSASTGKLGSSIAAHRRQLGLSQRALGDLVGRSESWVSQIERGVRTIDRMSVLRDVACALGAELSDLGVDTSLSAERPHPGQVLTTELRSVLSSTSGILLHRHEVGESREVLLDAVDQVAQLMAAARYFDAREVLIDLLPRLEVTARQHHAGGYSALAAAYYACSIVLLRLGDGGAAWVAADRGIAAAERTGCAVTIARGVAVLGEVLTEGGRCGESLRVLKNALVALRSFHADRDALPVVVLLWLRLACAAAGHGERARRDSALEHARMFESDLDPPDSAGRPVSVDISLCEVSTAVELGEFDNALAVARSIDSSGLPSAQAVQLKLDIAKAHVKRRDSAGALRAILEAENRAPDFIRHHNWVKATVQHLIREARFTHVALYSLALRCGVQIVESGAAS